MLRTMWLGSNLEEIPNTLCPAHRRIYSYLASVQLRLEMQRLLHVYISIFILYF